MRRIVIGLVAGLVLLAGCGSGDDDATSFSATGAAIGSDDSGDSGDASRGEVATDSAALDTAGGSSAPAPADGAARTAEEGTQAVPQVGLEAGSVDDNETWEDYLRYREAFALLGIAVDDLPVGGRRVLTVTDADGIPVLDATITIPTGERTVTLRTGADGRAVFLAPLTDADDQQGASLFEATVTHGSARTQVDIGAEPRQTIVLDGVRHDDAVRLDVLFLIDATGSMSDEIERLKANMVGVAEQIAASPSRPDVRFALTSYRDTTDDYVTRTVDFTTSVDDFVASLRSVVADGGGDTPEALNEAFAEAVEAPSWRTDDDVVRLAFVIADAPPHIGRGPSYVDTIRAAAAQGIRVFPIASSGTDDQAEYVLRQIAQATLGRFVFLSYGADGAALGEGTNIDADDYDVLALDQLVVKLVEEQLAPLLDR